MFIGHNLRRTFLDAGVVSEVDANQVWPGVAFSSVVVSALAPVHASGEAPSLESGAARGVNASRAAWGRNVPAGVLFVLAREWTSSPSSTVSMTYPTVSISLLFLK